MSEAPFSRRDVDASVKAVSGDIQQGTQVQNAANPDVFVKHATENLIWFVRTHFDEFVKWWSEVDQKQREFLLLAPVPHLPRSKTDMRAFTTGEPMPGVALLVPEFNMADLVKKSGPGSLPALIAAVAARTADDDKREFVRIAQLVRAGRLLLTPLDSYMNRMVLLLQSCCLWGDEFMENVLGNDQRRLYASALGCYVCHRQTRADASNEQESGLLKCAGCHAIYYCSAVCQKTKLQKGLNNCIYRFLFF